MVFMYSCLAIIVFMVSLLPNNWLSCYGYWDITEYLFRLSAGLWWSLWVTSVRLGGSSGRVTSNVLFIFSNCSLDWVWRVSLDNFIWFANWIWDCFTIVTFEFSRFMGGELSNYSLLLWWVVESSPAFKSINCWIVFFPLTFMVVDFFLLVKYLLD